MNLFSKKSLLLTMMLSVSSSPTATRERLTEVSMDTSAWATAPAKTKIKTDKKMLLIFALM